MNFTFHWTCCGVSYAYFLVEMKSKVLFRVLRRHNFLTGKIRLVLFRIFRRHRLRGFIGLSILAIIILLSIVKLKHKVGENQSLLKFQEMNGPLVFKVSQRSQSWEVFTEGNIRQTGAIFPRNSKPPITTRSPYLIPNQKICSGILALTYVIVVHSAPRNVDRRLSLRRTWANQTLFKHTKSRTVFLLGRPADHSLQKGIYEENNRFGDIVQGTFTDVYQNLTLKAVLGLRWITENCRQAKFVIKADDDVFINIPEAMVHVFPILAQNQREIICLVEPHGPIGRLPGHRWAVSHEYFSGLSEYPMPFCYGFATFYTVRMAMELFERAKITPFYKMDDVYVYGILASQIKGVTWRNAREVFVRGDWEPASNVFIVFRTVLVSLLRSDEDMHQLWNRFL
ncbi:beta-1,3-galactosyltransferase 1-like [Liolophura sinensis]|uniref:beta-1,3-galactosyltransferase 1-like n=1 Tax=Liolophura sinensis TaxID=3198878 RepID=UPI00315865B8